MIISIVTISGDVHYFNAPMEGRELTVRQLRAELAVKMGGVEADSLYIASDNHILTNHLDSSLFDLGINYSTSLFSRLKLRSELDSSATHEEVATTRRATF